MPKFFESVFSALGVGHNAGRYTYADDATFGPLSSAQIPNRWVKTTCGYCSVGCGMLVGVRGNTIVSAKGDPDHPVNEGRLCPKGLSEHLAVDVEQRLTEPSVDGDATGWDRALGTMLDRMDRIRSEHGPEAVAILGTGQLVTEEFYALGKLARLGMGVVHSDGNTTLCMASAVAGYKLSFGTDGPPGCYEDFTKSDCLILIGANIADNHPLLAPRVLKNSSGAIITIDPRITKTTMLGDLHLGLRPRTDITLLNGLIHQIIAEGLVDSAYVEAHTSGFEELREHVRRYTPEHVASECGLNVDDVVKTARAFGLAERGMIAWTMGVNHSEQGTRTVALINTLCAITGNIGKPGASPMSITGQCNAMGTRETGFTASMPGYRAYDNEEHRRELADLWDVPLSRIPSERGMAYPDIIEGILEGRIKALWIIGTNPAVSFPNRVKLEMALDQLELLVVQDAYETPTTALADIVLPAAAWGEKDGTYTNSERRVSRVRAAVHPPGNARSDFEIFLDIAERLQLRDILFPKWKTPEDAFDEWRKVSAGRPCDYSAMTYQSIETEGGIQWPYPNVNSGQIGTERLYTDGAFNTPDQRAQLHCVDAELASEAPDELFPFLLNSGRTVEHWHTRTKTGNIDRLNKLAPHAWVSVNPVDAARLQVTSGNILRVRSRRGWIDVPARVTQTVREGEIFVPMHFDEACVNRLTQDVFDPLSRIPNFKQAAVALSRPPESAR